MKKRELESALEVLSSCKQPCSQCRHRRIYTADGGKAIYYAFGCDALPDDLRVPLADSMDDLRKAAIDAVRFEMEGVITA